MELNSVNKKYLVQVGVFENPKDAEKLQAKLLSKLFKCTIIKDKNMYKCTCGLFRNRIHAEEQQNKLNKKGFRATIVESL